MQSVTGGAAAGTVLGLYIPYSLGYYTARAAATVFSNLGRMAVGAVEAAKARLITLAFIENKALVLPLMGRGCQGYGTQAPTGWVATATLVPS